MKHLVEADVQIPKIWDMSSKSMVLATHRKVQTSQWHLRWEGLKQFLKGRKKRRRKRRTDDFDSVSLAPSWITFLACSRPLGGRDMNLTTLGFSQDRAYTQNGPKKSKQSQPGERERGRRGRGREWREEDEKNSDVIIENMTSLRFRHCNASHKWSTS